MRQRSTEDHSLQVLRVTREWQRAGVYYVRTQAMCFAEQVPPELEFAEDSAAYDYVLALEDGLPVATCRLHRLDALNGKIERVVTLPDYRGRGYASACVREAERWLAGQGVRELWINSRVIATGLYEKLGYVADATRITGKGTVMECVMMHRTIHAGEEIQK